MDADRWAALQPLLDQALDLPPAERAAFLAHQPDPEVAADLAALLDAADEVPAILDGPPAWDAHALLDDATAEADDLAGVHVGPYRLVRELGRGGQGRVLLAERDDVGTQVALKLVHGALAAPEVVGRFLTERRVLAGLVHPHIARLLDAGTADLGGLSPTPYLVMEAVEGRSITAHVAETRPPLDERLRLFGQVCEAVAFAHGRLVVHRDLKPSNILVEDGPEGPRVKLLDFGIAKLLSDDAEGLTRTGQSPLTPEYAAPEQVLSGPVTVTTDVYALGVILYELLTDARPYDTSGGLREAVRAVCDEEPARPSTRVPDADRARSLRGDLDAIVLRALAKSPDVRYASVDAFLADLHRHRDGLPVLARRATARYRATKFVRRHALATSVAALVVVLGIGTGVREVSLRRSAELARDEAQATAALLTDVFDATSDAVSSEIRRDTLRAVDLLDRAATRLAASPDPDPALQARLTLHLGQIYASLGLEDRAASQYREGVRLLRPLGGAPLADALYLVGINATARGLCTEAEAALTETVEIGRRERLPASATASAHGARGGALACLGRYDEAISDAQAAQRYAATQPGDDGTSLHILSDMLDRGGRRDEAIDALRQSLALAASLYPEGHQVLTARRLMLGRLLADAGADGAAERVLRTAYETSRARIGPRHGRTLAAQGAVAEALARLGRTAEAEPLARDAVRVAQTLPPADAVARIRALQSLARVRLAAGRPEDAEDPAREAVAFATTLPLWSVTTFPETHRTLAESLRRQGRAAEAEAAEREAEAVEARMTARASR